MSGVQEFAASAKGFYEMTAVDQLLALAWFAEARAQRSCFDGGYMRLCFRGAGVEPPDMSVYLPRLARKRPPQLIKDQGRYRLAGPVRRQLDRRYGLEPTVVVVARMLSELPARLPDLVERAFLAEALSCYKVKAFRATVVMAWNLAYDHLACWLLSEADRLHKLNDGIAAKFPRKDLLIAKRDDFDGLKESELLDVMQATRLLDKNTCQILKDKLGRRNMAAHPSRITVSQLQADDVVSDLVQNVILRLS